MKAMVLENPCSANDMKLKDIPIPKVKKDWVLIKIKAFGINRAEILTREGHSPTIKLPRIIGIECVGIIEEPSNSNFKKGDKVFSMMGGMGREFDGSYAEYVLVPKNQVYPLELLEENWTKLAAYPELYYTAYGSLFSSLKLKEKETLLIRGGTGSVAIASIQLAKAMNCTVIATTRNKNKIGFLKLIGADLILIENENINLELKYYFPNGVDKILELIGSPTLKSSLKCSIQGGIVCMTGCLGGWVVNNFEPLDDIISESYLTSFNSTFVNKKTISNMFKFIEKYNIKPHISKVFKLDDISYAHKYLETNNSNGKVVVIVE